MGDFQWNAMNAETTHHEIFQDFQDHSSDHRLDTQLVMLEILRKRHPRAQVTCSMPHMCDLLGYAAAGHATATLDSGDSLDSVRYYIKPGSRLAKNSGILRDQIRFGRWKYAWQGAEYLIYELLVKDGRGGQTNLFYILSETDRVLKDGSPSATDKLLLAVGTWSTELHEELYVMDGGNWSKSHALWKSVQGCSWDDIILDSDMKASLIEDVHGFFENQEVYKKLSVPWKRGIIMHGVPGNGKTISIKAFINELASRPEPIPSLYVKSFDGSQGSKFAIRAIFSHARNMAPCLLIFEDLDSLVTDQTRSYFLNEVDGLEANDGILMIGSANHLDSLDPAISKRPSRFDRKYHFRLPGERERTVYCQFWRRKLADNDMVDFKDELCPIIAKMTEGFSFAYLKELFVWALLFIARGGSLAEVEEASGNTTTTHESSSSGSTSTTGLGSGDIKPQAPEQPGKTADALQTATENVPDEKSVVSEVEVPDHLLENSLLRAIQSQIKMLRQDMDDSKADLAVTKKAGLPGADVSFRMRPRGPQQDLMVMSAGAFMG